MEKLTTTEIDQLSGLMVLLAKAQYILSLKVDMELHKHHKQMKAGAKDTINKTLILTQKLKVKTNEICEIGLHCGVTDKGETDVYNVYNAMTHDAGDLLHLCMEYENAFKHDEAALVKLVSYAKMLCKGEQTFSSELIADILPK